MSSHPESYKDPALEAIKAEILGWPHVRLSEYSMSQSELACLARDTLKARQAAERARPARFAS